LQSWAAERRKIDAVQRARRAERAVVSDVPGTTRDAIEELEPSGAFRAVDTAGLKRKAKSDVFEKLSGIKAIGTLEHADVALLVADATTPPTRQELRVARYVFAHKKPLVVALNKSDLLTLSLEEKADLVRSWQGIFNLFPGAYVLLVSALEKEPGRAEIGPDQGTRGGLEAHLDGRVEQGGSKDAQGRAGSLQCQKRKPYVHYPGFYKPATVYGILGARRESGDVSPQALRLAIERNVRYAWGSDRDRSSHKILRAQQKRYGL